jgi:hypothetical protein
MHINIALRDRRRFLQSRLGHEKTTLVIRNAKQKRFAGLTLIVRRYSTAALVALLALALVLASGCASQPFERQLLWTSPQLPLPRVAQLPLTVGVHYSDVFRHYRYTDHSDRNPGIAYVHEAGSGSVALFDSVLAATFERVVEVSTWPPARGASIEAAFVMVPSVSGVTSYPRSITYKVEIADAKGEQLDSWEITGISTAPDTGSEDVRAASALRETAAQLFVGLYERPTLAGRLPGDKPLHGTKMEPVGSIGNDGIVILEGAGDDDTELAQCMKDVLGEGNPSVPLIESQRFRDAVFPWFEPTVLPKTQAAWARRLKDPLIGAGAAEAGTRYILAVNGHTTVGNESGPFACSYLGCWGVSKKERKTSLKLMVADFDRQELAGEIELSESGSDVLVGYFLPMWRNSPTEAEACRKGGAYVRQLLQER